MEESGTVRVRFAPSPTGNVHIGNIRVCIYNWLFARSRNGRMLLRIEDTDRKRSTPEAVRKLFEALEWLGLDFDEEPVYQSRRLERYREVCVELEKRGFAYFSSKGVEEKGKALLFRVTGDASFTDLILGPKKKAAADMADFVILKSDGTPVFHLANVVDDIDMGITHVLRGNDHVENTFRHVMLYRALGKEPPLFAHFPMIVNERGKPYSKRDGDAYVGDFKEKGYLPEALFNFLALCGWSPGDDREVIPREEMVRLFSLERVKASPAQFNREKLDWMNREYIKLLDDEELLRRLEPVVRRAGYAMDAFARRKKTELVRMYRERITTLEDFPRLASFFFTDDFAYDEKSVKKFILGERREEMFRKLYDIVRAAPGMEEEHLKSPFEKLMEEYGVGFLHIAQPLRIAVTGTTRSPGIFETLSCLGKEEVLKRMERLMETFYKE